MLVLDSQNLEPHILAIQLQGVLEFVDKNATLWRNRRGFA